MATGLPSQEQVFELLDHEFARAGYEIEDVVVDAKARPARITVHRDLVMIRLTWRSSHRGGRRCHRYGCLFGHDRYVLEVSSPGIDRPLTSEKRALAGAR